MYAIFALVLPALALATGRRGPRKFGPHDCVHVTQSTLGSCVLSTNCEGLDISKTEFAFDCVSQDGIVRHSYGVGGFSQFEEFDTQVKCGLCEKPTPLRGIPAPHTLPEAQHLPASAGLRQQHHSQHTRPEAPREVVAPSVVAPEPGSSAPAALKPPVGDMALHRGKLPLSHHLPSASARGKHLKKKQVHVATANEAPSPAAEIAAVPGVVQFKGQQLRAKRQQSDAQSNATWMPSNPFKGWFPWEEEKTPAVAKYGPEDCVSTYRNKMGHCVLQTNCRGIDISDYEFGLVCVDKNGKQVRHLFGKNSFDSVEIFDTLISCEQCLGLEETVNNITKQIDSLKEALSSVEQSVKEVSMSVQKLNGAVFPQAPAPAPAASPAAAAGAALLTKHQEQKKQNMPQDEGSDQHWDEEALAKAHEEDDREQDLKRIAEREKQEQAKTGSDTDAVEDEEQEKEEEEEEAKRKYEKEQEGDENDSRSDSEAADKKDDAADDNEEVINMD